MLWQKIKFTDGIKIADQFTIKTGRLPWVVLVNPRQLHEFVKAEHLPRLGQRHVIKRERGGELKC